MKHKIVQIIPADQSLNPRSVYLDENTGDVYRMPILYFCLVYDEEGNGSVSPMSMSESYLEPDIFDFSYRGFEINGYSLNDELIKRGGNKNADE